MSITFFAKAMLSKLLFKITPIRKLLRAITIRYLDLSHQEFRKKYPNLVSHLFDYLSIMISVDGRYEKKELLALSRFLKTHQISTLNKTAIDVGAHIGNHSLFFSNYFSSVFSYEPNPDNFQLLSYNVRKQKEKLNVFNYAIGDMDGEVVLALHKFNTAGVQILSKDEELGENFYDKVTVKIKKLDSAYNFSRKPVGLIKVDVEGFEVDVILGAKGMIKRDSPLIVFESLGINKQKQDIYKTLNSLGYTKFYFPLPYRYSRINSLNFIRQKLQLLIKGEETLEYVLITDNFPYSEMVIAMKG